jgi:hypothetical protein
MVRAVKRQRKNQEILRRSRQYYAATVALAKQCRSSDHRSSLAVCRCDVGLIVIPSNERRCMTLNVGTPCDGLVAPHHQPACRTTFASACGMPSGSSSDASWRWRPSRVSTWRAIGRRVATEMKWRRMSNCGSRIASDPVAIGVRSNNAALRGAKLAPQWQRTRCRQTYHFHEPSSRNRWEDASWLIAKKGRQDHESPSWTCAGHDRWIRHWCYCDQSPQCSEFVGLREAKFQLQRMDKRQVLRSGDCHKSRQIHLSCWDWPRTRGRWQDCSRRRFYGAMQICLHEN